MSLNLNIGDKIRHGPSYGMTCSERFPSVEVESKAPEGEVWSPMFRRSKDPVPICLEGESFVIGLKMCIMGEYKFHAGSTAGYFGDEAEQGSASGKREECIVCTKTLKPFKPFLVRKKDVLSNESQAKIS